MVSKNVQAISTLVDDSREAMERQAIAATFGHAQGFGEPRAQEWRKLLGLLPASPGNTR
jgi:hypothetical protein